MKLRPNTRESFSPSARPRTSLMPPGVNGETIVTVPLGQFSASPCAEARVGNRPAWAAAPARINTSRRRTASTPRFLSRFAADSLRWVFPDNLGKLLSSSPQELSPHLRRILHAAQHQPHPPDGDALQPSGRGD